MYNGSMGNNETQINAIWSEATDLIAPKISVTSFTVWIKTLKPVNITDSTFYLLAATETAKNMIMKSYIEYIREAIYKVYPYVNNIVVFSEQEAEKINMNAHFIEDLDQPMQNPYPESITMFDEQYIFDNFVVGESNKIAFAAAKNVAENPGLTFNPLFIYGGVGLGKTHIIHSIGNYIKSKYPKMRIMYATTEQFTNEFIESISKAKDNNSVKMFREKYRNVDVLMLDDIQFIANKDSTQEALFHAFNDLHQTKRQVIFTSDRHPKDLRNIEERLKSRFNSGLTVDISAPDIETRIAILEKKATQKKFVISREAITYIAEKIDTNIRELEGALSKVIFYSTLNNVKADSKDIVNIALKDEFGSNENNHITIDLIVNIACEYFSVEKKDILAKKKTKQLAEARQIAIYLISEYLSIPLTSIGKYFGGKDHSTIIHARDKIANLKQNDSKYAGYIADLNDLIKAKTK